METLLSLLTSSTLWSVLTPAGIVAGILGYALYSLFKKYDALQELRVADIKKFNEEYQQLARDVNATLDLLIKLTGNKNGNGGSK
jgi:uncharacterized protein YdbL (DUF1318 family)